jgi:predicted PhzF superfamily epimerase YddE/YHI9
MRIPYYQVDAFSARAFGGNPAGVCVLEQWPDAGLMQRIADENNLAETAFIVGGAGEYALRWFTPTVEVDLCGHATLGSAFVVFEHLEPGRAEVRFQTASGILTVRRAGELLELDFPARPGRPCAPPEALLHGLGAAPREVFRARDFMAVYESEEQVRSLRPAMDLLRQVDCLGVIATAAGNDADFVSRFFAPGAGIDEDPVTGSAHCTLVPYWSARLGKRRLHARQISRRGGELWCEDRHERVGIAGQAALYLTGTIHVDA